MKKRLRKKKAKKLSIEMDELLKWVTGYNPVMMGRAMGESARRLYARASLDRAEGILGLQFDKISFDEELIGPMPQVLREAYVNGEWLISDARETHPETNLRLP